MRIVPLQHLATFVEVIKAGAISRAAQSLHYSQPTVTSHVQSLERNLGVQLVWRTPTGVQPTPAGEVVHGHAVEILRLLCRLRRECDRLESRPSASIPGIADSDVSTCTETSDEAPVIAITDGFRYIAISDAAVDPSSLPATASRESFPPP
jgi:molybdenum-dependent DNA-binding transcriptional regulator ModE